MKTITVDTKTKDQRWISPYYVTVPITMAIFALYANEFLPFGAVGVAGGAAVGLLWSAGLGFVAERIARREKWHVWLANAPVFLGLIAMGLSIGGGLMYIGMMQRALNEPSTTSAVLSVLMQPAVPFFIVFNSLMEFLMITLSVFWNWHTSPNRRMLILAGVLVYFVQRIWTHLVYAGPRLEITLHPLSPADVEWFKQTLATDYRVVLNIITYACFLLAAFVPVPSDRNRERK
jgi:hypothetical protein